MDTVLMLILFSVFLAVVLALTIFGLFYVYYGLRHVSPFVPTSKKTVGEMLAEIDAIEGKTVLDLGSGTGDIILAAARKGARAIGVEINPFLVWITRWRIRRARLSDRATVIRGDFFKMPLPRADVVTLYLMSGPTAKLRPKMIEELPSHAVIISNSFRVEGWTPQKENNGVLVYRLPQKRP